MRLFVALALIPALGGCAILERIGVPFTLSSRSAFELQQSCEAPFRGPSDWLACRRAKERRVAERFQTETFDGYDAVIIDGEMAVDSKGNVIVFDYPSF